MMAADLMARRLRALTVAVIAALALTVTLLTPPAHAAVTRAAPDVLAARALDWAEANTLGHTYEFGGAGPGSYDCSGLVMAAYAHADGSSLPHSTYAMLASPHLHQVPIADAPRGALLFFGTGHVELKTIWPHTSYGAHSSSDPIIGWRQWWPGSYEPTAAYIVS